MSVSTTNSQPLAPGASLGRGRYIIEQVLGQGGFGYVYLARDQQGRECAIKQCTDLSPAGLIQFGHEGAVQKILDDATFVRVYAQFVERAAPASAQPGVESLFTVMEYVPGRSLEDLLAERLGQGRGPFTEQDAVGWAAQLLRALGHAHAVGVIHRDLKPANILLLPDGKSVKVIDFGIAKIGGAGAQTLQGARGVSPGYSPPEQYAQTGQTDAFSDIYALGATLYHLLTGETPTDAPLRLSGQALTPPRQHNPAISPLIEDVILQALELNVADRYQDAGEMLAALEGKGTRATGQHCPVCRRPILGSAQYCSHCGAAAPRLRVMPGEIEWGKVTFRRPAAQPLWVENASSARLRVHLHAPAPWLRVTPAALTLGAQEQQQVSVELLPEQIATHGRHSTAIQISAGSLGMIQAPVTVELGGPMALSAAPGERLGSLAALIGWCDHHWLEAVRMLRSGELPAAIYYLLKSRRGMGRRQPAELPDIVLDRVQQACGLADNNLALETVLRAIGAEPPAFRHNWGEVERRLGLGWRPDLRWLWPWWGGPGQVDFVIRNCGRGYLHGRVESLASWLEVRQPHFGCLAGQAQRVALRVQQRQLRGLAPELLALRVE